MPVLKGSVQYSEQGSFNEFHTLQRDIYRIDPRNPDLVDPPAGWRYIQIQEERNLYEGSDGFKATAVYNEATGKVITLLAAQSRMRCLKVCRAAIWPRICN